MILAFPSGVVRVSFLDRLKREGNQQKAAQEQESRERDDRDAQYLNEIEPRMKALVVYLEGLVATLNEVKPQIVVKMPITGYGDLGAQPTWNFKIDHDRRYRNFAVSMTWTLRVDPEHAPVIRAEGVTKVKALTGVFRHNHLGGIKEELRSKSGEVQIATFHARGYIKASFEAKVSADDPVLRMVFSNASWLGSSQRQFSWQQINDDLCDRIARFIVRESDALFTEEVPAALRQKLGKEISAIARETAVSPVEAEPFRTADSLSEPRPAADPKIFSLAEPTFDLGDDASDAMWSVAKSDTAEPEPPSLPSLEELNAALAVNTFAPEITRTSMPRADPKVAATSMPAGEQPLATDAPPVPASYAFAPGVIPAPAPVGGGEMIEIDESKLHSPKDFMSRMSSTFQRLRDEEDNTKQ